MDTASDKVPETIDFYEVRPKEDCPHHKALNYTEFVSKLTKEALLKECKECHATQENWICLSCDEVLCSRYENSHMLNHSKSQNHPITLSFSDGSFWCYACESYIYSKELQEIANHFKELRFHEPAEKKEGELPALAQQLEAVNIKNDTEEPLSSDKFTKNQLVAGLKGDRYKRIIFLTGAGISVSAGIPDFRSDTGIYAQLGECDLPYPEAIFEIGYFKEHPETFYKLAKVLIAYKAKPTAAHYFIKMLADRGVLLLNFTQNVDGLEVDAGIDPKYLMEAHGHVRSAHCVSCHTEKNVEDVKASIQEGNVFWCECGGPVKPDIVFFGEALPASFYTNTAKIAAGDLVIVMGTSLKVFPFAGLVHMVGAEVPIVLINRENTAITRENFLFLQGDIDEQVGELVKELGWEEKVEQLKSAYVPK